MTKSVGKKLLEMVERPDKWYNYKEFETAGIPEDIFSSMEEDPYHLKKIGQSKKSSFLGGYVVGFALRERLRVRDSLKTRPKEYQYMDPLRFAQCMQIYPESLPETIDPPDQKERPFLERISLKNGLGYGIYLGSLAYLSLPILVGTKVKDLSLEELIKKFRLSGESCYKDEYFRRTDIEVRQILFSKFTSVVAASNEPDRLMGAAKRAAAETLDRFDLERGVKVETYMDAIVRGRIMDELRETDSVSRTVREAVKKIKPIILKARENEDEPPTIDRLMEITGRSADIVSEAYKLVINGDSSKYTSLNKNNPFTDHTYSKDSEFGSVLKDSTSSGKDPSNSMETEDTLSYLLGHLDLKSQEIVVRYHLEGDTMRNIGASLNLSESRVSQLHDQIMNRLKEIGLRI